MAELVKIPLTNLINWSVRFLLESSFNYNPDFELVPIDSLLIKNNNRVQIDNTKYYKRITVRAKNNGVELRDEVIGEEIGTKNQFEVKNGQFILSKIDARNGAFGIIPKELDGAIVTNDFPTYDINDRLVNPNFFLLITTTKEFIKFAQSCSAGTTNRQRIDMDMFLMQQIPLPSIQEQNRIVAQYNQKIQLSYRQEKEAITLEKEIDNYLTTELDVIKPKVYQRNSKLYFTNFEELTRWDYWVNSSVPKSGKYKNEVFASVVLGNPQYGANVKGVKQKSETRYIRITDINEAGYLNEEFVSPATVEEQYLLKENDFLIARSGNTVGKTLLYKKEYGRAIFAGYLVRYKIDFSKVLPEYLFLFTKSFIFKEWINSNQRVAGQPNINGQEFLKSPIVIPPLNIQLSIVNRISDLKTKIKSLRVDAIKNQQKALQQFEQEIFKN